MFHPATFNVMNILQKSSLTYNGSPRSKVFFDNVFFGGVFFGGVFLDEFFFQLHNHRGYIGIVCQS